MGTEETYRTARDAAWARYHDTMGDACSARQQGLISEARLLAMRDEAWTALDDTLAVARKAAGYQSA